MRRLNGGTKILMASICARMLQCSTWILAHSTETIKHLLLQHNNSHTACRKYVDCDGCIFVAWSTCSVLISRSLICFELSFKMLSMPYFPVCLGGTIDTNKTGARAFQKYKPGAFGNRRVRSRCYVATLQTQQPRTINCVKSQIAWEIDLISVE